MLGSNASVMLPWRLRDLHPCWVSHGRDNWQIRVAKSAAGPSLWNRPVASGKDYFEPTKTTHTMLFRLAPLYRLLPFRKARSGLSSKKPPATYSSRSLVLWWTFWVRSINNSVVITKLSVRKNNPGVVAPPTCREFAELENWLELVQGRRKLWRMDAEADGRAVSSPAAIQNNLLLAGTLGTSSASWGFALYSSMTR